MNTFSGAAFRLIRHLVAGLWFAVAAAIPVLFLINILGSEFPSFGLRRRSIVALAIVLSGIVGLFFGAAILNPEKIKTEPQAAVRGLIVGVLSYFCLFTAFAIPATRLFSDAFYGVLFVGIIFGIGFVIAGWLILITGALAGWFLYLLRETFITNPNFNHR